MFKKYAWVFIISMVPLIELRGAIPVSQGLGLPILPSYVVAVVGNMVPVPFIYLFARKVLEWGADKPLIGKFFSWCLEKGKKGGQKLQEKGCLSHCFYLWGFLCRVRVPGQVHWRQVFWIWILSPALWR